MASALRIHCLDTRRSDRMPYHAGLSVVDASGCAVAPLAQCIDVGLGGLRVSAAAGPRPGTPVRVELPVRKGGLLTIAGRVAWSRETLHLPLFGAPRGSDDDALFGIAFMTNDPLELAPIARMLAVRAHQRVRVHRLQRTRGRLIHA